MTRPGSNRTIGLVLDTTTILAHATDSMHAHEPVLLADEDGQDIALPVHCLIAAARRDPTCDLRELLHLDRAITVMPGRRTDAALLVDWIIPIDGRW